MNFVFRVQEMAPSTNPSTQRVHKFRGKKSIEGNAHYNSTHRKKKQPLSGGSSQGSPVQVPLLPQPSVLSGYSAIQASIRIWLETSDLVALHEASAKPSDGRGTWLNDLSHLALSALAHCSLVKYHSLLQKVQTLSHALASSDMISVQFASYVSSAPPKDLVLALTDRNGFDFVVTTLNAGIALLRCVLGLWMRTPSPGLSSLLTERLDGLDSHTALPGIDLSVASIKRLAPAKFLDDALMDHFIRISPRGPNVMYLSSQFCKKYIQDGIPRKNVSKHWDSAWKWGELKDAKREHMLALRGIIMPVNLPSCQHWVLLYADLMDKEIMILDSLAPRDSSKALAAAEHQYRQLLEAMRNFMDRLYASFNLGTRDEEWELWKLIPYIEVPRQSNLYDCGVYVTFFAKHLLNGKTVNHELVPMEQRIHMEMVNADPMRLALLSELIDI